MERSVEAGDLDETWPGPGESCDALQIEGLVRRSERRQSFEHVDHSLVDDNRTRELIAPMHHSVASGNHRVVGLLGRAPVDDSADRRGVWRWPDKSPADEFASPGVAHGEAGSLSDAVDLTTAVECQVIV